MRFTERAQRIIILAQEESRRLNHDYVGTEHILLGLVALGEGIAAQVLANLGVDRRRVRSEVENMIGTGDNVLLLGEIPFTPRAKKVLEYAVIEAQYIGNSHVGTEYLLLGLIREAEGVAARVLEIQGLRIDAVREEVVKLGGEGHSPIPPSPEPVETKRSLGQQLLAISMAPEVEGILLSPGTSEAPTIIILLKKGATPDAVYLSLASALPAIDHILFKEPGKVPISRLNGEWKEDLKFGAILTF
jgi:hypothetical protein